MCELDALTCDGAHYTASFHCAWLVSSGNRVESRVCNYVSYNDRTFAKVDLVRTSLRINALPLQHIERHCREARAKNNRCMWNGCNSPTMHEYRKLVWHVRQHTKLWSVE